MIDNSSNESVYFFTFHKCASSLFSGYVLKNVVGLQHVNYAAEIYQGKTPENLEFKEYGQLYGPIRLQTDSTSPVYNHLIKHVSTADFVKDKIAIFLVRDPRDLLVSSYYSSGFSHGISSSNRTRTRQLTKREKILSSEIDDYIIEITDKFYKKYKLATDLIDACSRSTVVRYEDMIDNFDLFISQLNKILNLADSTIKEVYKRTRPREVEDITAHRRSGLPGGFKEKLKPETILYINDKFETFLNQFDYG